MKKTLSTFFAACLTLSLGARIVTNVPTLNPAYTNTIPTGGTITPTTNTPTINTNVPTQYSPYSSYATNAGNARFATNAGAAAFSTNSGTAAFSTNSGTAATGIAAGTGHAFDNSTAIATTHFLHNDMRDRRHWTQFAFKNFSETRTNTATPVADPELAVWLDPNSFYYIKMELFAYSVDTSSGGGLQWFLTMPNVVNMANYIIYETVTNSLMHNYLCRTYYNQSLTSQNGVNGSGLSSSGNSLVHNTLTGSFSTAQQDAALPVAVHLKWAEFTAQGGSAITLLAGSYIELEKAGPEMNSQMAFMLEQGNSTNTVVDAPRSDQIPVFARSPDGLTKICAYSDTLTGQFGNLCNSQVRYLVPGATNWSAASLVFEKPHSRTGGYGITGITQLSGTNYVVTGQYLETWPSSPETCNAFFCAADWESNHLNFHSFTDMTGPTNSIWTAVSTAIKQAPNGDWLYPGYYAVLAASTNYAGFWRSTNNCATWGNFQTVAAGQDEMQFVTNGQTLYALTRGFRYASTNSGATWSAGTSWPNMTNNMACKPAVCLSPNGKWVNIYRAAGNHTYQATSADGLTWTNYTLLDTGLQEYSDLLPTGTNAVEGVYSSDTTNALGQLDSGLKFNTAKVKYIRFVP